MARQARGESLHPSEIQIVHTIQRCVRQAFLCGVDQAGVSFEHRRQWIRNRLEFLASVFGIDCLTYTVLSNHLHLVLRSRPDIVEQWSDLDVARRWWRLCPLRRTVDGLPAEPTDAELGMILTDPCRLTELRLRLSDISWWMRCTSQNIAQRANREEEKSGRFWEGRFRAQLIIDEASLLACSMYVDLNPIRAAMAATPEDSNFTGAKDRIDDLKNAECTASQRKLSTETLHEFERRGQQKQSGWMAPIEIREATDPIGPDLSPAGRRASNKGFLPISLSEYLALLDWTGRSIRSDKRGSIPAELAPILKRLRLDANGWCTLVEKFGRLFKRVAGTPDSLAFEAQRRGQNYLQAPGASLFRANQTTAISA